MKPYYEDDKVTLYHGDCRDILPQLDHQVDLMFTDPPYGMSYGSSTGQAAIAGDGARQGVRMTRQMMPEAVALLDPNAHILMFCHWESWPDFYDALSPYINIRNALIWHKAMGGMGNIKTNYLRDYEVILYGARGNRAILGEGKYSNVLSGFGRPGRERLHPTEKPNALLRHLIRRHSPEAGLVLDPFAGSGSALLAARQEGRRSIGVEIDERYCEIAAKRLAASVPDADAALDLGEWEETA